MDRIALVTGATGVIGPSLVGHLLARGYRVRALLRPGSATDALPEAVEIVKGDIADGAPMQGALEGVDCVFHLAAKLHINNPSSALRDEYRQANVEGTRRLAEAAKGAAVRRLVFFSTINVYGATRPGEVKDEASPLNPDSLYAETKVEGERIVLDSLPAVVLRLAAVYGPRMKGNYPRLLNAVKHGRLAMIGDGLNRRTLVHVEDVCAAALDVAVEDAAAGESYNVTDGEIHTLREIVCAMSEALGHAPTRLSLPARPVRFAAGLLEDSLRLVGKRSPVGRATVDKFVEDIAVSGEKLKREMNYRPQYDLSEGWRQTVEQMGVN